MSKDQTALNETERENLSAYLDGELAPEAARSLEAKLNTDPQARAEADSLRKTWELLDYLPRPAASATFTSRTLQCVAAVQPAAVRRLSFGDRRRWTLGLGWAAAVLLAGTVGFAGMSM